eukprot:10512489-Ditylum_brightwellii.AAC.1
MEGKRLPRKFLATWASNPWPMGRLQTTIQNMYLDASCMIGAIDLDDKQGRLEKWSRRSQMTQNCGNNGEESSHPI